MPLRINDEAPNFTAQATHGPITFHDWIGDGWAILFSHPEDVTPVRTGDLGYMAGPRDRGFVLDPTDDGEAPGGDAGELEARLRIVPQPRP